MPVSSSFRLFAHRTMYPVLVTSPSLVSSFASPRHAGPGRLPHLILSRFVAPDGLTLLSPRVRVFSVGNVADSHPRRTGRPPASYDHYYTFLSLCQDN